MMIDGGKGAHASARIDPKYTHYAPMGCGRDSYIITNNGGLLPLDNLVVPATGHQTRGTSTQLFVN
jgi:hypothetical protein